jgi:hypothetical protein
MSHYGVYHKQKNMGYPALDANNLAIYTNKSSAGLKGRRVWLIAGEGKPPHYYLRATLVIGGVEASDRPDFRSVVCGTDGQLLDPMPQLNGEPWFEAFVREQGSFAFGFNRIKSGDAIECQSGGCPQVCILLLAQDWQLVLRSDEQR